MSDSPGAVHRCANDDGTRLIHVFSEAERVGQRYLLTEIRDRCGNRIVLVYENGLLARVTDSVGREVRVRRSSGGRISAFEVLDRPHGAWVARRNYVHDEAGDLVRVDDPVGTYESYTYDDAHRLTSLSHASGLTFYYRYDRAGRCIETWGAYPDGRDPSLAGGLPDRLADNQTQAKGIFHVRIDYSGDDYREVIDSVRIRRIFVGPHGSVTKATSGAHVYTRTFDADGRLSSATDAVQATTRWTYDAAGRLASVIDPLGGVTSFAYDEARRAGEVMLADGSAIRRHLDRRGLLETIEDDLGPVVAYEYNDRGLLVAALLPNGGRARMEYGAHGNRVRVIEPDGAEKRIEYDWFGRPRRLVDAAGEITEYTYDRRGGLASIVAPGGRTTRWTYDAGGRVIQVIDDDGLPWEFVWGGLHPRLVRGRDVRRGATGMRLPRAASRRKVARGAQGGGCTTARSPLGCDPRSSVGSMSRGTALRYLSSLPLASPGRYESPQGLLNPVQA
ncbi:hypothetical protein [Sorangium sp. So ce542]|uniref:hypothetical protein n=1 Tax=Sorangium sp. So ce542 TaxID=3133316 RepID=UPI003F64672F